jgi:CheY-like chemotaxis protein
MLTGNLPYPAESVTEILEAHLTADPTPIDEAAEVTPITRELINWLLQKRIGDRPQTAAQVIDMIEPLLERVTARSASGRLTILVVDPDLATLAFLRGVLESDGYRVAVAETARDGIDTAFEQTPAVIFLDARIKGGFDVDLDLGLTEEQTRDADDALGFLRIVRSDRKLKDVPVVVMSDKTISGLDPAFWKSGAAELVIKPLTAADVVEAVRKVFPVRLEGRGPSAEGRV